MFELYHNHTSVCAAKVRFPLEQKGLDWSGHIVDIFSGERHRPEHLRLNPLGVVPTLVRDGARGAGYIERNWPPALKETGAWPLASLRQSFLNGALTRLVDPDPDPTLRSKTVEFVTCGDFGLASGDKGDGSYERVWFQELVAPDEVAFEAEVFLLRKATAEALRVPPAVPAPGPKPESGPVTPGPEPSPTPGPGAEPLPSPGSRTLRLTGNVPPETWNRLGTKILPKLRTGKELTIGVDFSVTVSADSAIALVGELRQILQELGLEDTVRVE